MVPAKVKKPVLMGRDKPLRDPEAAEKAILNALVAMSKQSEALAQADYSCAKTVREMRRDLKMTVKDMAKALGIPVSIYDNWEQGQAPDMLAKTMAYTAKVIDETYRLLSFAGGGPDSRPELSLGDLLKYLTAEQFAQFVQWVDDGKAELVSPKVQVEPLEGEEI